VHLKSLEDEFEYMDSTMPKKEGPGPTEETQSPRVGRGNRRPAENMPYPDSPEATIRKDGSVVGEDCGSYCEGDESPDNTNIRWKNGYPYFKGTMDNEGKEKENEYGDEDYETNQIDDEEQQMYYQKLRERQAELEKQAYLQKQEKHAYLFEQPSPDKQYQEDIYAQSPERKYQEDQELEAALNGKMEASNLATELDEKKLNNFVLDVNDESKENIVDNQPVWDANDID
jgi:hypothetical protein